MSFPVPRFFTFLCLSWSLFFIMDTNQLQSSQTQVLLQLRKQLEYPKELDIWLSNSNTNKLDLCFHLSSPQVNITCQNNYITGITIFGPHNQQQSLSRNFSMDSLVATLSRLNSLTSLTLVSLGLWGPIPDKIHRLQSLQHLDLSWNFLGGSLPQTFSRIASLRVLKLDGNSLNATLPDWFGSLKNLTSLSLRNNRFTGSLPSSIQKLTSLTDINLSNNGISGKLIDLSGLSRLTWLDFSNNKFHSELLSMPKGVVAVLLANNSLFGRIPDQYSQLNQLQQLDLSYNAIEGTPNAKLFALPNIVSLNLATNRLSGSLPMQLRCGSKLGLVDISNNRFKGSLPPCLSSAKVKFSGNCLLTSTNNAARDQHPEAFCVESHQEKKDSHGRNVAVLIGVIGGIGVVLVVLAFGFVVLCRKYCPSGTSEQHLLHKSVQDHSARGFTSQIVTNARFVSDVSKLGVQVAPAHLVFSLDELKAATNFFDRSNLMGEGSTGKIYKGRLENGIRVAIRCLMVSKKYTIRNLKLRLDLLAKLRHSHLVCLLGHCIDTEEKHDSGANKVYLVYEYVPNGNYRAHLSDTDSENVLKWSDRLAILLGIAKAVQFLHTGIIPGFLNNRLKANNILINEHRMGKLSDYGLSIVAQEFDKEEEGLGSWQAKSLDDDIYSFGLILLESLVGPSVCARKESFLLNEMVSLGNEEGQRRIVDPTVLASCSQDSLSIVISLTINCISPDSSNRPSFEDILWNLQYAAQVQSAKHGDPTMGKTVLSP